MKIFRLLTTRITINQIPYVIFQATSQFSFKFCITLQCHDTLLFWYFLAEALYALDKKSPSVYSFLDNWMKSHPIHHAIFEITRSGFIQILYHCLVSWKITPFYFFSLNLKSKWNFRTLEWLGENLPNSSSYLKPQVSFSLSFASLFSFMRDTSSVLICWTFWYLIWTNRPHQRAKFQTFNCPRAISPIFTLIVSFC